MQKLEIILFFMLLLFSCQENKNTEIQYTIPEKFQYLIDDIKKNEYTNIDLFRQKIDALKEANIDDNECIHLYVKFYSLKADFLQIYNDKSIHDFNTIYDDLKEKKRYKLMAEIDLFSALYFYEQNEKVKSAIYIKRLNSYCFEHKELLQESYVLLYGLSTVSIKEKPLEKKKLIEDVLNSMENQKWNIYQSRMLYNLAIANFYAGDIQQSIQNLLTAINKDTEINNNFQIAKSYNLLSFFEDKITDNVDFFVKYQKKAIAYKDLFGNEALSIHFISIGHAYFNNEQYKKAFDAYNSALEYNNANDSTSQSLCYSYIGWAHFKINPEKHFHQAIQYYSKALSLVTKGDDGYKIALERKVWSLEKVNRIDEVNELISELLKEQNLAYKERSKNEIAEIQTNNMLEIKYKNQNLKNLEHQNQLQKAQLEHQKFINRIYYMLIVPFLVLLYLFFQNKKNLKMKKELNIKLQNSILQINEQNQKISMLLALNEKNLFSKILKISTYKDAINTLISYVSDLSQSDEPISANKLFSLNQTLKTLINEEEIWDEFKSQFEKTRPGFFNKLKQINPDISISEFKHCTYIVSKLSTKDVANLINVSPRTVETVRYRIKKKLGVSKKEKLADFLTKL